MESARTTTETSPRFGAWKGRNDLFQQPADLNEIEKSWPQSLRLRQIELLRANLLTNDIICQAKSLSNGRFFTVDFRIFRAMCDG
jgi:hypothetical protein